MTYLNCVMKKTTRGLKRGYNENKQCYYFLPSVYISVLLTRDHHQSKRLFYSYNKILKAKKLRLFTTL